MKKLALALVISLATLGAVACSPSGGGGGYGGGGSAAPSAAPTY